MDWPLGATDDSRIERLLVDVVATFIMLVHVKLVDEHGLEAIAT